MIKFIKSVYFGFVHGILLYPKVLRAEAKSFRSNYLLFKDIFD